MGREMVSREMVNHLRKEHEGKTKHGGNAPARQSSRSGPAALNVTSQL